MSGGSRARSGRLRARFTLAHVQERADAHLRGRWQRRLDAGEAIWCWRCRLQGVQTRVDPDRWHISDSARSPECAACHVGMPSEWRATAVLHLPRFPGQNRPSTTAVQNSIGGAY